MSMIGLLNKFGYEAERIVDASGRLHFASAATGSGLALKKHTFHGGVEAEDNVNERPWWDVPGAMDEERSLMEEHFPGFTEMPADGDRPPVWAGTFNTGRGGFSVLIAHRFDRGLPRVIPVAPSRRERREGGRMVASPHTYINGNLCVASEEDWVEGESTAVDVVLWAAHWHACYVDWFTSGRWPVEGYRNAA